MYSRCIYYIRVQTSEVCAASAALRCAATAGAHRFFSILAASRFAFFARSALSFFSLSAWTASACRALARCYR